MNVVYDIGCCHWGTETSIDKLVQRFSPDRLLGYDPQAKPSVRWAKNHDSVTKVIVRNEAAWTHDRGVCLVGGGSGAVTVDGFIDIEPPRWQRVPSFDLAASILSLPDPVVVKMDAERGEYVLIPHLIATGAISNVSLLLVEWHSEPLDGVKWEPWHE